MKRFRFTFHRAAVAIAATAALLSIIACKQNEESQAAKLLGAVVTQTDRIEAENIFTSRCLPCHGPTGGGDGPASNGLTPKPRNFHDASWQTSVTTEHITKIIRYGGAAVGKSAAMPANPDLTERGGVVAALTGKVRGFGGR
jgi:mono/diheme cytochrome c family protein